MKMHMEEESEVFVSERGYFVIEQPQQLGLSEEAGKVLLSPSQAEKIIAYINDNIENAKQLMMTYELDEDDGQE